MGVIESRGLEPETRAGILVVVSLFVTQQPHLSERNSNSGHFTGLHKH